MPVRMDQRAAIANALAAFGAHPLPDAATRLFAALGSKSDRRLPIHAPQEFIAHLGLHHVLSGRDREVLVQLQGLHLLSQISDAERSPPMDLFDSKTAVDASSFQSYLFFAAELPEGTYSRAFLSGVVGLGFGR